MNHVSFQTDTSINDRCASLTFNSFPIYSIATISQNESDSFILCVGGGGGPSKSGIPNGVIYISVSVDSGVPLDSTDDLFYPTDDTVLGIKPISTTEYLVAVGDKVIKAVKEANEYRSSAPTLASIPLEKDDFIVSLLVIQLLFLENG